MTTVTGAYGRRYSTVEAAKADWDAGKDFKILRGPYCSKRDFGILDTIVVVLTDGSNKIMICGIL